MLLTPHTFVGVAIATTIPNPLIAVPLAFFSHFAGDLIPHWDFYSESSREERIKGWIPLAVMADMALGVAVGIFYSLHALWVLKDNMLALNIFLCGIASVLPDAMTGPSLYISKAGNIFKLVHKLQSKLQFQVPLPWGAISQIVVVVLSILIIKRLSF
jgi:hypothetical protein